MDNKTSNNRFVSTMLRYKYYIVFLVSFLLYFQLVFFGFVKLDDIAIIENKQEILSNISNIDKVFTTDAFLRENGSFYRPLQTLTFMIESQFVGSDPWLYHILNTILHSVNCVLLLWLFIALGFDKKKSFVLALIFAIHPLFTHAVSWIPSRNDLMLVIFLIPSFIMFLKYVKTRQSKFLLYHLLLFLLAVFTKETAMAFPGVCLVYFYLIYYKSRSNKPKQKKPTILSQSNIILLSSWIGIIALEFIARIATIGFTWTSKEFGFGALLKNILIVPEIFGKFFVPYNQPVLSNFNTVTSIIGVIAILGLIIWLVLKKKKDWSMIIFGLCWFLLFLIPGSMYRHSYADFFYDYLDHRAYLPMIGMFIFFSAILPRKLFDLNKKAIVIIMGVLIVLLSGLTVRQSLHYRNPIAFWFKAVKDNPYKAGFYLSLGKSLMFKDRYKTAQKVLMKGINLMPGEKNFYLYLGEINFKLSEFNKSVEYLNKYIIINPNDLEILKNLGGAYANIGSYDKAFEVWIGALNKTNDKVIQDDIILNILSLAIGTGRIESAFKYAQMLELNNKNAKIKHEAYIRYGDYLKGNGMIDEAIDITLQANSMIPNHWIAYYKLGSLYAIKKDYKNAIYNWEKASEVAPSNLNAYRSLLNHYTNIQLDNEKAEYYQDKILKLGGQL